MKKSKIFIVGMNCSECARNIESSLEKLKGVIKARVNFPIQKVIIMFDEKRTNIMDIQKVIERAGVFFCFIETTREMK